MSTHHITWLSVPDEKANSAFAALTKAQSIRGNIQEIVLDQGLSLVTSCLKNLMPNVREWALLCYFCRQDSQEVLLLAVYSKKPII